MTCSDLHVTRVLDLLAYKDTISGKGLTVLWLKLTNGLMFQNEEYFRRPES